MVSTSILAAFRFLSYQIHASLILTERLCCRIRLWRLRQPETNIQWPCEDVAGQQQDLHPKFSSWPSRKSVDQRPTNSMPENHLAEKLFVTLRLNMVVLL